MSVPAFHNRWRQILFPDPLAGQPLTEESDGGGQAFGATVTGIDIRADLINCPAFFGSDFFQCRPDIAFDRNGGSLGADIDIALFPAKTIECLFMGCLLYTSPSPRD